MKLRGNGRTSGKAVALEEPLSHDTLVQTALEELKPLFSSVDKARLFLDGGDEVEAGALEKDDVVYVSFDGADWIDPVAGAATVGTEQGESASTPLLGTTLSRAGSRAGSKEGSPRGCAAKERSQPVLGKKFDAFVSHAKAEAAMEARFVQSWLEQNLGPTHASVHIDMCIGLCTDMCRHVRRHVHRYAYSQPRPHMCVDICVQTCYIDMCMVGVPLQRLVVAYVAIATAYRFSLTVMTCAI